MSGEVPQPSEVNKIDASAGDIAPHGDASSTAGTPPEISVAVEGSRASVAGAFMETNDGMAMGVDPPGELASKPLDLPDLAAAASERGQHGIELLSDVELSVKIELGRATMLIEDVLKLGEGSVVELDKLAGDPVDVLVNDRLIARGEVLVLNDNFCVRIHEIVAGVS